MTAPSQSFPWVLPVLGRYGISLDEVLGCKPMRGGLDNEVVQVKLKGKLLVARRHRAASFLAIEFQCVLLDQIAGNTRGVATPIYLRTIESQPFCRIGDDLFTVYGYIPGSHPVRFGTLLLRNICEFARSLNEVSIPNCRVKTRDEVESTNLYELTKEFILFNASALSFQQREMLQSEHERVAEALVITDRFSRSIVHGDLHAGNILVNSSGVLTGVIDFDDAWIDSKVWEFAEIARGHCFNDEGCMLNDEFCNLFIEAGLLLNGQLKLDEFTKLVRSACFRNMLRIFQRDYMEVDQKRRAQRQMNQWLDLRRWMSTCDMLQA